MRSGPRSNPCFRGVIDMLQIIATGRLGKDAELRTTQAGDSVLGFSVGTDVGFGDKKKTVWLECSIWGNRAEKLAPYLLKGAAVTVIGQGDMRPWESRDGKSGTSLTCRVSELTMQGGKRDGDSNQTRDQGQGSGSGQNWEPPPDMDDEIPF